MTHRWQTFLGEFVKPIADKFPNLLFWCSYYYEHSKFRVHSDKQDVHDFINQKIESVGFVFDANEESGHTLSSDLGASRFIDQSLGADAINRRADLVLRFLCSTVRLYLDGLVKVDASHWEYRKTLSDQNPLGNNFESLVHLVANLSRFEFLVQASLGTVWQQSPSSQYIPCRLWS